MTRNTLPVDSAVHHVLKLMAAAKNNSLVDMTETVVKQGLKNTLSNEPRHVRVVLEQMAPDVVEATDIEKSCIAQRG